MCIIQRLLLTEQKSLIRAKMTAIRPPGNIKLKAKNKVQPQQRRYKNKYFCLNLCWCFLFYVNLIWLSFFIYIIPALLFFIAICKSTFIFTFCEWIIMECNTVQTHHHYLLGGLNSWSYPCLIGSFLNAFLISRNFSRDLPWI